MRILELFCGTKSISKAFKDRGHEVFTVDVNKKFKPDLCIDILKFETFMLPSEWRIPDIIWASPPCTTFSVASLGHYWIDGKPKSWKTYMGLAIAKKTLEVIQELKPKHWFIENPRGMMRKQQFMQSLHRKTVTYCQYGESYMKPTDIWTNDVTWIPRPMCKAGDDCHEEARRGTKTGVQGRGVNDLLVKGTGLTKAQMRSKIPNELCHEIVTVCEGKLKIEQQILCCTNTEEK